MPDRPNALDLKGMSVLEEVDKYLKHQGIVETQPYLKELNDLGIQ